nr:HAD family hydrolase [Pseudobacteroides cellulosolvens]
MNKNYNVVLFDLDGTLTDSKVGITKSVKYALNYFGIAEPCLNNLEKFIGPSLRDSFMEFYGFNEEDARKAIEKYREYYSVKGILENTVYPYIPELLNNLHTAGKTLMVATSKPTVFAEKVLSNLDLLKYFSRITGSNLDGSRIEKHEVIEFVLRESNMPIDDSIVMIGDRKHDIVGANKAGIDSIGVLYGYGSLEELEMHKPTYIANTVSDIECILL